MKIYLRLLAILILLPFGKVLPALSGVYHFSSSDLQFAEQDIHGITYSIVSLEGCINDAPIIGAPFLPVKDVKFVLSPDEKVTSIKITRLDSTVVARGIRTLPMQYPSTSGEYRGFVRESKSYYFQQSPGIVACIERHGVSADAHLVTIRLYPVQYDPYGGNLKLYTTIGIALETSKVPRQTMYVERDSFARIKRQDLFKGMVENPGDVATYLRAAWCSASYLSTDPSKKKMAIVTASEFIPAFVRLAEWKTQKGCSTGVYSIEDIGNTPAQLLGFVREKTGKGCEHILLGGGDGIIPVRESCYREPMAGSNFTDLYYADCSNETGSDIHSAWDESGNGVYGEPYQTYIWVDAISFVDDWNGWIVGRGKGKGGSAVVSTQNGGTDWEQCAFLDAGIAHDIYFLDENKGILVGDFGAAYSRDRGISWEVAWGSDSTVCLYDVDFHHDYGWAIGEKDDSPVILRSIDQGLSWEEVWFPELADYENKVLQTVDVVNPNCIWIAGIDIIMQLKVDSLTGGISCTEEWASKDYPYIGFSGCAFFSESRGCVFGYGEGRYRIYSRSVDPETCWVETSPDTTDGSFYVSDACLLPQESHILAFGSKVFYSTDYGFTWDDTLVSLSLPSNPSATSLPDDRNFIWLVGIEGGENVFAKTSSAGQPASGWLTYSQPIESGDKGVEEWTPDVAVGRLPAQTMEEAEIMVDKIITYEKSPPADNYLECALFMAADMEYHHDYSCLVNAHGAADVWESNPSRQAWRLFNPLSGEGFSGSEKLSATNAQDQLQSGYNFVYHQDHGTAAQFGTAYKVESYPENVILAADIPHFDNGLNKNKQSVFYTAACAVAQYTRRVDPGSVLGGNVACEFLRNPYAGALTFIGGVDNVSRSAGRYLGTSLVNSLFASGSEPLSLGWALIESFEDLGDQGIAYNMHLLGDPSLRVWFGTPLRFAKEVDWFLDLRSLRIGVNDDAGKPVSGARVFEGYQSLPCNEIAADREGNLHLVFTDEVDGTSLALYGFSADTGETWSVKPISPNEQNPTLAPALGLRNNLTPYAAYFVDDEAGRRCLVTNISTGTRVEVAGEWNTLDAAPAFDVASSAFGHLAVRSESQLFYYKIDLDQVDQTSASAVLESATASVSGKGDALAAPVIAFTDDEAPPVVVAEFLADDGKHRSYYWLPGSVPELISEGRRPHVAADGRFVVCSYIKNNKPYLREGYLGITSSLELADERTFSAADCIDLGFIGARSLIWTNAEGVWVSARLNQGWSEACAFDGGEGIRFSPSGMLNLYAGLAACSWVELSESGCRLHVYSSSIADFPKPDVGAFPGVIIQSPQALQTWPMGYVRGISWHQDKASESVDIELSIDNQQTWKKIGEFAGREPGLHYFNWEVGRLADRSRITEPEDSYTDCYVRVKSGECTGVSYRFAIGEEIAAVCFAQGSNPAGRELVPGVELSTCWTYSGFAGCAGVRLELSANGGESFLTVGRARVSGASGVLRVDEGVDIRGRKEYSGSIFWEVPSVFASQALLRLVARDTLGNEVICQSGEFSVAAPLPLTFALDVLPLSDETLIRYSLPYATHVNLKVYDVSGRVVTRLVDGEVQPGVHDLVWNAKDNAGRKCASGVYFVRYVTEEYQASKKMVLIK
jgi:hypothetical protein